MSHEQANAKLEERARKRAERDLNDLREVLSTASGLRFVWKRIIDSGFFVQSYTGIASSTDFNEGKRAEGIALVSLVLKARPEAFLQMMRNAESERIKDEAEMQRLTEEA